MARGVCSDPLGDSNALRTIDVGLFVVLDYSGVLALVD
jgi:hypothetical protein